MGVRLVLAVVVTLSFFSSDVSAQRRSRGFGYAGITVYEHPDYRGNSVTFREDIADLRQHGLNDRISSLEVDGNQAWEVCRDINFSGGCRVFSGSIDDLREEGWSDRISSLRPAGMLRGGRGNDWGIRDGRSRNAAQSRLVIYDRPNYRGDARDLVSNSTNLGAVGDQARSVRVYGGTWELCEGAFRNARCVTVTEDVPDLRSLGMRNGVTSVHESARQSRWPW